MLFDEAVDGDAYLDRALVLNPNVAWVWHSSGLAKALTGSPKQTIALGEYLLDNWLRFHRKEHAQRWATGLRKAGLPD